MRRFFAAVVLVPLAVIIVMFAVANRGPVVVSFDPFDSVEPAVALTLPLYILVFVLLALGVVIGGVAAWLRQHRWRARARQAEAEARDLRRDLQREMQRSSPREPADTENAPGGLPVALSARPPLIVPPAA